MRPSNFTKFLKPAAAYFATSAGFAKNDPDAQKKRFDAETASALREGYHWGIGQNRFGGVSYSGVPGSESAPEIKVVGSSNFYDRQLPMSPQTIIGIGSISKQFAAATLIKLWDLELLSAEPKWFPEGIDTKLKFFMPFLKEKYPDCVASFENMEKTEDYKKIRLRDLLNHTHGLGCRNYTKATNLILERDPSQQTPLTLSEMINANEWQHTKYGQYNYGNLGSDLSAMIIEVVTSCDYDEAVRKVVLDPYGLNNTYTQSDNLVLHLKKPKPDVAIGYALDKSGRPLPINNISLSRAAVGFKSTVGDLAKFAPLFMMAEMFESPAVKEEVLNRKIDARTPFHLAIATFPSGSIGHGCNDLIFRGYLMTNPQNGKVNVSLNVAENITDRITREVFEKLYPKQYDDSLDYLNKDFEKAYSKAKGALFGSEGYYQFIEGFLQDKQLCPQRCHDFVSKYSEIRQEVVKISPKTLVENREEIIQQLHDQAKAETNKPVSSLELTEKTKLKDVGQTPQIKR